MADPLVVVTAIGAGVAIAQPWAIAAWKRFARRGSIDIYVTGNVEVGFSNYGPTLCLGGTLRAVHRDMFLSSIDIVITREKDKSEHKFEWLAFRPPVVPLGSTAKEQMFIEIASGFMVTPNMPRRFNIVFADLTTRREIDPLVGKAFNAFWEVKKEIGFENLAQLVRYDPDKGAQMLAQVHDEYVKHRDRTDAFSRLTKICYWEAGSYGLSMSVKTTRPDRCFKMDCGFDLTEDDAKNLELNVLNMLDSPLDLEVGYTGRQYLFAYPEYKDMKQARTG